MIKHFCDRCGKEIPKVLPFANCTFPIVKINVTEIGFEDKEVDLCDSCKNNLLEWFDKGRINK